MTTAHPLAALAALLDIVGPAEAPALLRQLNADLGDCDAMIQDALPRHDWPILRRASHNLTALAGTAGATGLQHLAEALNQAAHAGNSATVQDLGPTIRHEMASLAAQINALSASREPR